MNMIKQRKFVIGQQFLNALINDEITGLDADDLAAYERFVEHHRLENSGYVCDVTSEEPSFARCDISGLMSDCFETDFIWMA